MKGRMLAAAAAGVLATAGLASAQPGPGSFSLDAPDIGSTPEGTQEEAGPAYSDVYGTHPAIRKLFFWKKPLPPVPPKGHPPYGPYGPLPGSVHKTAPAGAGVPAAGMPGTLVFPVNPYVRSPRDYFMYEPGGR